MAQYINKSGGTLVFPGGREVANGAEVEVTADGEKNIAVSQWIDGGKLVSTKEAKADSKSGK